MSVLEVLELGCAAWSGLKMVLELMELLGQQSAQEGKEGVLEWRKVSLLFEITVPFGHDKSKEVEMNWIVVAPGCSGV